MKFIFTLCALICATALHAQQTASVRGKVLTSDGAPAEFVSVGLKGTAKGAVTNGSGQFELKRIGAGSYVLRVSFTGLETQEVNITVVAGTQLSLPDIVLKESNHHLKEVMINGRRQQALVNKQSDYIARMPLKNLENPQVYTVIGQEIMKQQQVNGITEALNAGASVSPASFPSGGIGVVSRGFLTDIGARNGLPTTAGRSQPDITNVERIEILKGPSGTLFGATVSSFGGVVNLVTKKPYEGFHGEIAYNVGSFGLNRATADINTPLNADNTALLRVNASLHRENSFKNAGHNNSFVFAPSVSFKVNNRLQLLLDMEIQGTDQTRMTFIQSPETFFRRPEEFPLGYDKSIISNDIAGKTFSTKYFLEARYQLSGNWTSVTNASYVSENVIASYQSYARYLTRERVIRSVGVWGPIFNNYTTIQQNFNGKFNTGAVAHKLLVGLNYSNYVTTREGWSTTPIDTVDVTKPFSLLRRSTVDHVLQAKNRQYNWAGTVNDNSYAAYVSDVASLNERLFVMLSLRFDRFEQSDRSAATPEKYKQNSLTPKLGLVYQLVKEQVSVFGNYMAGYQNSAPMEQPDGSLFIVKPIFAKQWEGGIKAEAFNRRLNATVSYYQINIDNATRVASDRFVKQDGKQSSKGIEFEIAANPLRGLNVLLAGGVNENKYVRAAAGEGKTAANAPAGFGNYWVSYQFGNTVLKGVGLGFGGNYVDKIYTASDNVFFVPSYHIMNATLFYDTAKWRFGIRANNLGNKVYWDGYAAAQKTRNAVFNVTYKF